MKYFASIILVASVYSNAFAENLGDEAFSLEHGEASIPVCASTSSDSDGDGWGWENMQSCKVGGPVNTPKHPICVSADSDSDGDGWGWENGQSCRVVESSEESNSESTENLESSVAPEISQANASNSIIEDNADGSELPALGLQSIPEHFVSQTDAEISFSFSDFSQAYIEYGKDKSNTLFGAKESSYNYKEHTQKLRNLTPQTLYYYRIHFSGQNNADKDLVSDWFSFTSGANSSSNANTVSLAETISDGVIRDPIKERDSNQRAILGTSSMGTWGGGRPPSGASKWLKVPVKKGDFYGIGLKNPVIENATEGWVSYNIRLKNWSKSKHSMKLPGVGALITGGGGSSSVSKWIGGQGGGGAGGTTGGPDGKGKSWSARLAITAANNSYSVASKGRLFYEIYHRDSKKTPPDKQYGEPGNWNANILDEKWHNIKHYVKLNDIGKSNGVIRGYFDGKLAFEKKNISFVDNPKYRNIAVFLNVYHGGANPATDYFEVYMDEIHFGKGNS